MKQFCKRPTTSIQALFLFCLIILSASLPAHAQGDHQEIVFETEAIFPHVTQHVHGPTVVELPNGDLLAAWFQGSGERWADDVAIMGSRRRSGRGAWSKPFVMADVPGFPDINPVLFLDARSRLWLVWYTVIANQWETSLIKYRISQDYVQQEGCPKWEWQDVLHVKPGDPTERGMQPGDRFVQSVEKQVDSYQQYLLDRMSQPAFDLEARDRWQRWRDGLLNKAQGQDMIRKGRLLDAQGGQTDAQLGYPYFRRMGWQTKNKPFVGKDNRIILPLYSDGFSFSLMALTDDGGQTWRFSTPLVGPGNIQASIAQGKDGTLVAYMRDNGPPPQRLHMSRSRITASAGLTSGIPKSRIQAQVRISSPCATAVGCWPLMTLNEVGIAWPFPYPLMKGRPGHSLGIWRTTPTGPRVSPIPPSFRQRTAHSTWCIVIMAGKMMA